MPALARTSLATRSTIAIRTRQAAARPGHSPATVERSTAFECLQHIASEPAIGNSTCCAYIESQPAAPLLRQCADRTAPSALRNASNNAADRCLGRGHRVSANRSAQRTGRRRHAGRGTFAPMAGYSLNGRPARRTGSPCGRVGSCRGRRCSQWERQRRRRRWAMVWR